MAGLLLALPGSRAADCPVPEVPGVGCVLPTATPTPTREPTPEPTPTATAPAPTEEPQPPAPSAESTPATVVLPGVFPLAPPPVADNPVGLTPQLPPPTTAPTRGAQPLAPVPAAAVVAPLSGVVASSFALVVFGLVGCALLLSLLPALLMAPTRPRGATMTDRHHRFYAGLGVLALAALVGGIGWYRVSGEPLLNRQIPFLASAGMVVVLLAVLGGALIVAEQLRTDQNRIGDLEDAVRQLTEALAPSIELPARRDETAP
jgi:hypothetical protein